MAGESQSTAVRNAAGRATEAEESPTARANHRVLEYGRNGLDISRINDRSGEPDKRWENRVRFQWGDEIIPVDATIALAFDMTQ